MTLTPEQKNAFYILKNPLSQGTHTEAAIELLRKALEEAQTKNLCLGGHQHFWMPTSAGRQIWCPTCEEVKPA